jgi:amino acid transporter
MKNFVRNQWPILLVYFGILISLAVVIFIDFRSGAILLSLNVLLAFWFRLRLPDSKAGWLRIRRRRVDLTVLATLGIVLFILALVVPQGSK